MRRYREKSSSCARSISCRLSTAPSGEVVPHSVSSFAKASSSPRTESAAFFARSAAWTPAGGWPPAPASLRACCRSTRAR
jgi:hypothetical protein